MSDIDETFMLFCDDNDMGITVHMENLKNREYAYNVIDKLNAFISYYEKLIQDGDTSSDIFMYHIVRYQSLIKSTKVTIDTIRQEWDLVGKYDWEKIDDDISEMITNGDHYGDMLEELLCKYGYDVMRYYENRWDEYIDEL